MLLSQLGEVAGHVQRLVAAYPQGRVLRDASDVEANPVNQVDPADRMTTAEERIGTVVELLTSARHARSVSITRRSATSAPAPETPANDDVPPDHESGRESRKARL